MSKIRVVILSLLSLVFPLLIGGCNGIQKIVVSFNTVGGTSVEPQKLEPGDLVTERTGVEKEGYVLDDWFSEGKEWNFGTPPCTRK